VSEGRGKSLAEIHGARLLRNILEKRLLSSPGETRRGIPAKYPEKGVLFNLNAAAAI
jgi:hypothetical protein